MAQVIVGACVSGRKDQNETGSNTGAEIAHTGRERERERARLKGCTPEVNVEHIRAIQEKKKTNPFVFVHIVRQTL